MARQRIDADQSHKRSFFAPALHGVQRSGGAQRRHTLVKRHQRIDLDSLRLLQAIEQHGSFAAAAQALSVVTSTITHAVRGLEERLGLQIFDRSGRRVRFTGNGRALLERGRALLAQAAVFDDEVQALATGQVLHGGGSLCSCQAEVRDGDGQLVACGQGTFKYWKGPLGGVE